uniref:Putative pentatricopeptide repeat-containing protein At3g23330 n=1 Tax=Tanacetum cinerariifolium TaxID=118510 RepID=A0A6L2JQP4_TANCI|nr:putative pentatricopeptide repeat-containing protein At3g23330 [Tanacetum cinerariifolium]
MKQNGIYPDHNVYPSVIKCSTHLMWVKFGASLHGSIIRVGLEMDLFTANALLSMYAHHVFDKKSRVLDGMESVRRVFERMVERDVVSYNTVVLGYVKSGMFNEAMGVIKEMGSGGIKADAFTLSNVLGVVKERMDVLKGKEIHGYGIRHGFDENEFVVSGLSDVYTSCNMVEDSYRLFCSLRQKDCVSWCSMIAAYVQNGLFDEGLRLFRQMISAGIKPVPVSCSSIIPACAHLTTLPLGQQLHGFIIRSHFDDNMFIASSLVNMYAKCGNIKLAKYIFDSMKQHDLVSWTAMIMGCASHGHAYEAISLFKQMEVEGFTPNSVTFVAVLTACSHAGMVNEGLTFFNKMVEHYNISPEFEHYACIADLLGRAGKLEEAFRFLCKMPENKTTSAWLPLLAACRVHKNVKLAEKIVACINEFDSDNMGAYVLLSNTYSSNGRNKDAANLRSMLSKKADRKKPACSWISVEKKVHAFSAGDESHPYYVGMINILDILFGHMVKQEYVADYTAPTVC